MPTRARANGEGSIYPYKNGYAAYVWVQTPQGTRRRKYVYGKNRDEVHDKWLKLHQQAMSGPVATKTPKLAEYLDYWLHEIIEPNRAPLTYVNYELFVRLYITPMLGEKRLNRLYARDVQMWINKIPSICQCCIQGKDARRSLKNRRCCAVGRCCGDIPSERTISDIRACLRAALNCAIRQELISKNPAAMVTLPSVRKKKRKSWSTEEAHQFLEAAWWERDPLYAAYVLVLVFGMRKGEVLGLRWDDIDFDAGELGIELQLQRARRRLVHRKTKSEASDETLPLVNIVETALRHRQQEQAKERQTAGKTWQHSGLVFTTAFGTPVDPRNFNRSWDARCSRAEVRKITVHDGRRTCATLLVDLDVHPRHTMRILRHAQFSVTMEIYAQASSKKTRDALKRLGESLDR